MLAFDMLYDALMRFALKVVERNVVPDFLLRRGIRFLLAQRLRELKAPTGEEQQTRLLVRNCPGVRLPLRARAPLAVARALGRLGQSSKAQGAG
jgi:hypothetical protein